MTGSTAGSAGDHLHAFYRISRMLTLGTLPEVLSYISLAIAHTVRLSA